MAEGGSGEPQKFSLESSTDPVRQKLWQARQEGKLPDFQIEVNGTHIPCHKLVLSTQSEYFSRMLEHENTAEVMQGRVDLQQLDVEAVKLVVGFLYSGNIVFDFHMAEDVIKVVDRLQLTDKILLKKISEYIIPHLCPDNCLGWFKFGEQINLEEVKLAAHSVMIHRLSDVCNTSEFFSLTFEEITVYLQMVIENHPNHDHCLQAFVTWAMHDARKENRMFEEILKVIDLNKCSFRILKNIYEKHGRALLHTTDLLHQFTSAALSSLHVIVTGGCKSSQAYNQKTWLLDLKFGSCIKKASRTVDAYGDAKCASPDGMISVGGKRTNFSSDYAGATNCVLYNKNTDTWVDLPSLHAPRSSAAATCVQDTLLMVIGGRRGMYRKAMCLDLRTSEWTICDDMLQGQIFPIVSSIDDCVYVIFSTHPDNTRDNNGSEITLQCYNTTTRTWSFKSPLPGSITNTRGARAVTVSGQLYLVGGDGRICAKYDPNSNSWVVLSSPLYARRYGAALEVNGKIILSGGVCVSDGQVQDSIEEYDPSTDSWRLLPVKLPKPLFQHCMILG